VAAVEIKIHGVIVEAEETKEETGVEVVAPGKILLAIGEIVEVVSGKEDGKAILEEAEEDTEAETVEDMAVEILVAITKEVVAVAPWDINMVVMEIDRLPTKVQTRIEVVTRVPEAVIPVVEWVEEVGVDTTDDFNLAHIWRSNFFLLQNLLNVNKGKINSDHR